MLLQTVQSDRKVFDLAHLPAAAVRSLYVHIPFCFHKCHYCDFYSITRQTPDRMGRFVDLILAEADLWLKTPALSIAPQTVFFGGGTPSLLPEDQMRRLIAGLRQRFDFSALSEWTVEVNPATASAAYCQMLREAGVDRLSFGAQSFNRAELQVLERHHDPGEVFSSVALARAAGFSQLNLDLIYGIPGQDLASWRMSLEAALAADTPHLSCYDLTYEPNTPMAVKKRMGRLVPVAESLELQMFHHTRTRLSHAGLAAYEISNFARPGEACQHNLVYWTGGNYVGLGPSAASHVDGWRWKNRPHLGEWEEAVRAGATPAIDVEHLGSDQRAGELAMLMLRLAEGLNCADFAARIGRDAKVIFADQIDRYSSHGLLHVSETHVRLTDRGLEVADAVAAEFLSVGGA